MMLPAIGWLAAALTIAIFGACWTAGVDSTTLARRRALFASTTALAFTTLSWASFTFGLAPNPEVERVVRFDIAGHLLLAIDGVNAPLLPLTALLFTVTIIATLRSKLRRFSFARCRLLESITLSTFAVKTPWIVVALLGASAMPIIEELRARGCPVRAISFHFVASLALAGSGLAMIEFAPSIASSSPESVVAWGYGLLAAGIAVRAGLLPAQCWVVDMFENASLGTALLMTTPVVASYATLRLLTPSAPVVVLTTLTCVAVATALYCAAMSVVAGDARRFVGQLTLGQAALVVGAVASPIRLSVTAGLVLSTAAPLAWLGVGLTIRSLEARTGRISMHEFQGLHAQTPTLAALFLVTGLAAVGFPGTLGFFGTEMFIDAAANQSKLLGAGIVLAATLSGVAVLRAYGRVFLGGRHRSTLDLRVTRVELGALLILVALLLGKTILPQAEIDRRHHAANRIEVERRASDSGGRERR